MALHWRYIIAWAATKDLPGRQGKPVVIEAGRILAALGMT